MYLKTNTFVPQENNELFDNKVFFRAPLAWQGLQKMYNFTNKFTIHTKTQ